MAYAHVAHDVQIGNHTQLGNAVTFAGHVTVEDWAVIEAFSGVHQYCRIGKHAFVGGYSVVTKDVLPYSMTVSPRESKVFGENKVGLERRGFSKNSIEGLHKAFRLLTKSGLNTTQAVERIRAEVPECAEVTDLLAFMERSERGFVK
jgi:UDP-N-acetylglucosamine acyltransferase